MPTWIGRSGLGLVRRACAGPPAGRWRGPRARLPGSRRPWGAPRPPGRPGPRGTRRTEPRRFVAALAEDGTDHQDRPEQVPGSHERVRDDDGGLELAGDVRRRRHQDQRLHHLDQAVGEIPARSRLCATEHDERGRHHHHEDGEQGRKGDDQQQPERGERRAVHGDRGPVGGRAAGPGPRLQRDGCQVAGQRGSGDGQLPGARPARRHAQEHGQQQHRPGAVLAGHPQAMPGGTAGIGTGGRGHAPTLALNSPGLALGFPRAGGARRRVRLHRVAVMRKARPRPTRADAGQASVARTPVIRTQDPSSPASGASGSPMIRKLPRRAASPVSLAAWATTSASVLPWAANAATIAPARCRLIEWSTGPTAARTPATAPSATTRQPKDAGSGGIEDAPPFPGAPVPAPLQVSASRTRIGRPHGPWSGSPLPRSISAGIGPRPMTESASRSGVTPPVRRPGLCGPLTHVHHAAETRPEAEPQVLPSNPVARPTAGGGSSDKRGHSASIPSRAAAVRDRPEPSSTIGPTGASCRAATRAAAKPAADNIEAPATRPGRVFRQVTL